MSFYLAASGAYAAQKAISVVSDNIANMSTTAFKSNNLSFSDIIAKTPFNALNAQTGRGVITDTISKNYSVGSIAVTGLGTDLAISGSAFFVTAPKDQGAADDTPRHHNYLTRNGSFKIDPNGYLVSPENYNVLDTEYLPIRLPTTTFIRNRAEYQSNEHNLQTDESLTTLSDSVINLSTIDESVTLGWQEYQDQQLVLGDVFLRDMSIFLVVDDISSGATSAIKIGDIEVTKPNSLEISIGNPRIATAVSSLQMVDVEQVVDVEVEELVTVQVTESELVEVDQVYFVNEKVYLDSFSTQTANFNTSEWISVNERFFAAETTVNGFPSPEDPTYGNPESDSYLGYAASNQYESDQGEILGGSFQTQISSDGSTVTLETSGVVGKNGYQTVRGPFIHSNEPIFLQGNTTASFNWLTEGRPKPYGDAFDVLAYLRNTTTGEYTIAVNDTGKDSNDTQTGEYSFTVPTDGLYDIVFVGGSWDANGGGALEAVSRFSNLTYQARDFEFQDVEKTQKVWQAQSITRDVEVLQTVTKQETRIFSELQEVTSYENLPINLDPSLFEKISSKITASKLSRTEGLEVAPLDLDVEVISTEGIVATSQFGMALTNVTYLGQETVIDNFDSFDVSSDGEVSVFSVVDNSLLEVNLGTLAFVNPVSTENLRYLRNGYFFIDNGLNTIDARSISAVGGGSVVQGALERSNVDLMSQLTSLIKNQFVFQASSKAVQAYTNANKLIFEQR